jgi:hypothetical protein
LSSDAVLLLFLLSNRHCDEKECFSINFAAVITHSPSYFFCPASYSPRFSSSFSFSPVSDFCHDLCSFPLTLISCFYLLSSQFVLIFLFILLTCSFVSSSFLLLYSPHVRPSFLISFALSSLPPCPPFFITSSPAPSSSRLSSSTLLLIRIHIARSTNSGYSRRAGVYSTKPGNGENQEAANPRNDSKQTPETAKS